MGLSTWEAVPNGKIVKADVSIAKNYPFADGNRRTGRLWQSLILQKWKEVFVRIPVGTLVYENQGE